AAIPGLTGKGGPLSSIVQQGSIPGEYLISEQEYRKVEQWLRLPGVLAAIPPGKVIRWGNDTLSAGAQIFRPFYVVDSRPIITGDYLQDANPSHTPTER